MPTASPEQQGLPFRPSSFEDFSAYVRTLRLVFNAPLQHCQTLLAQIYGYSGLHELKALLKTPELLACLLYTSPSPRDS